MKKSKPNRGFAIYTFKDRCRGNCSLQKSSNAEEDQVWLGLNAQKMPIHQGTGQTMGVRMLIDRKLAAKLALKLAVFSETGEI